jgi:hypothetical protein
MTTNNCPQCGSFDFNVLKTPQSTGFQFVGNRACNVCGAEWTPGCPRWGALLSLIVGLALLAPCVFALISTLREYSPTEVRNLDGIRVADDTFFSFGLGATRWFLVLFAVTGVSATSYAIAVLAGRAGSLKVVKDGDPSSHPQAPTQNDSTAVKKVFGRIRWFHVVAGLFAPPFAVIWGLYHLSQEKWRSGLTLLGISVVWGSIIVTLLRYVNHVE